MGLEINKFKKIYTFIDFGNVDYWYERDQYNWDAKSLEPGQKLVVDIGSLALFAQRFSLHKRFYYGLDPQKPKSIRIISKAREYFDKTITKPIQKIRHYLNIEEEHKTTRKIDEDVRGKFVYIPKCNFDTEICVDAIRFINKYDTFCLFSSDADFAYLLDYLKRNGKMIILVKSGFVQSALLKQADLVVSAQDIKKEITIIKQKPRL